MPATLEDALGLLDSIKGSLGRPLGSVSVASLSGIQIYPVGLSGMPSQLQQGGYGRQVDSWLGHGSNNPITGRDLEKVLSNVKQIEQSPGIPADQVLNAIAKALPEAVDKQSPDGQLAPT